MRKVIVIALVASLAACSQRLAVDVQARSYFGNLTPLHIAVYSYRPEDIRKLIEAGADINARDNAGWTPLHHAAIFSGVEVVTTLLDSGADIYARDNIGTRPRDYAAVVMQRPYV